MKRDWTDTLANVVGVGIVVFYFLVASAAIVLPTWIAIHFIRKFW